MKKNNKLRSIEKNIKNREKMEVEIKEMKGEKHFTRHLSQNRKKNLKSEE